MKKPEEKQEKTEEAAAPAKQPEVISEAAPVGTGPVQPPAGTKPDSESIIRTIILGSDWEDALTAIVVERGLDPLNLDITALADTFMIYLNHLKSFDFRIPARFILITAILLNMKCETILQREEERLSKLAQEEAVRLNLDAPMLTPPVNRQTARPVALTDLIAALNKTFEIKRRKEPLLLPKMRATILIPQKPVDIEKKIGDIYARIRRKGVMMFSDLVPVWRRTEVIATLIPLLYLANRGKVVCEQKEMFKDITIQLK